MGQLSLSSHIKNTMKNRKLSREVLSEETITEDR